MDGSGQTKPTRLYETYTAKTSEIVRTLSLSAIGVAWLFSGGLSKASSDPAALLASLKDTRELYLATILAISALALDLLQYVTGACLWGSVNWSIDQVLLNDKKKKLKARARAGWTILRLNGSVRHLLYNQSTASLLPERDMDKWQDQRDSLREAIQGRGKPGNAGDAVAKQLRTWQSSRTAVIPTALWAVKVVSTTAAYVVLLLYLT
jgi:hypothetical protein